MKEAVCIRCRMTYKEAEKTSWCDAPDGRRFTDHAFEIKEVSRNENMIIFVFTFYMLPWLIVSNAVVTFWHPQPYFTIISAFFMVLNGIWAVRKSKEYLIKKYH